MPRLPAIFLLYLTLFLSSGAFAEKRVALVIGNSAYALAPLGNPKNDAHDLAAALRRLEFEVTEQEDLGIAAFDRALDGFVQKAKAADVALFFFSGHGVQIDKRGYLAPIDVKVESESSALRDLVAIQEVISRVENSAKVSIIMLDACRNNQLQERLRRIAVERDKGLIPAKGLPQPSVLGSNTLVVYATVAGETASDGIGRNSPFTAALLTNLETPGLEIEQIFKRVTASVMKETGGKQQPERWSRLQTELILAAPPTRPVTTIPQSGTQGELVPASRPPAATEGDALACRSAEPLWLDAMKSRSADAFKRYLEQPNPACKEAALDALDDVKEWERLAAPLASSQPPGEAQLERCKRYLAAHPKGLKANDAQACIDRIALELHKSACIPFVKDAVALARSSREKSCGLDGHDWSIDEDVQRLSCLNLTPGTAAAALQQRKQQLAACEQRLASRKDLEAAQAASDPLAALKGYLTKHADGEFADEAKKHIAHLEAEALQKACKEFAAEAVELAAQNAKEPCAFGGEKWVVGEDVHLAWCLKASAEERKTELQARTGAISACTAPRRDEEAWREAQVAGTAEALAGYLAAWEKGKHVEEANAKREPLCAGRWPEAKRKGDWVSLTVFVEGGCAKMKSSAEAEQLRAALDEAAWRKAKNLDTGKSYKAYLRSTAGYSKDSAELNVSSDYNYEFSLQTFCGIWYHTNGSIARNNTGKYCKEALSNFYDLENWAKAQKENTCAAYGAYLSGHPEGRFKALAGKLQDDRAWDEVLKSKDYRSYIDGFPNGRHLAEAKRKPRDILSDIDQDVQSAIHYWRGASGCP